jgi:hypothetical protein
MMARSTIAPRQRPDTLMQLSRSLILEAILYRAAGPYMLAQLGPREMSDLVRKAIQSGHCSGTTHLSRFM